ncbi:hypothetical protein MSPP1_003795 [Malassezia sp. CBS 17886]|nr:hypothetical protein MSPP1_003795 [Malassezia sp. CBS 17886]
MDAERASITIGPAGQECTVHPAVVLGVGEAHSVAPSAVVRRFSTHYGCSCPAWRFHAVRDVKARSCEHLVELLGEEYEQVRLHGEFSTSRPHSAPTTPSKGSRARTAHAARQVLEQHGSPETPRKKRKALPSTTTSPTHRLPLIPGPLGGDVISMDVGHGAVPIGRVDDRVHILLASTWPQSADGQGAPPIDPAGWWISEKLDGVRAFWDGKQLWSRRGKPWPAPAWFCEALPRDTALDGELWIGRGLFERTAGVCRSSRTDDWAQVKYIVFDAPAWTELPVERRWGRLAEQFRTTHGVYVLEHTKCRGDEHLSELLERALACDGEGVMLRRPDSLYEYKRSTTLYKLKPVFDAEARIVGYEDGQNQCAGLVGSLLCNTLTDPPRRFRVGSGLTDRLRRDPPPLGSLISFQYGGVGSLGVPRFPRYRGTQDTKDAVQQHVEQ